MQEFKEKIFNNLNIGYIEFIDFMEHKVIHGSGYISEREKSDFYNNFRLLMSSFNYMGQDEVVADIFINTMVANKPESFYIFAQCITLLGVSIKESGIETDMRSQASLDFLSSDIALLKDEILDIDIVAKESEIKELMLKAGLMTHNTIFQSFIRTLTIVGKKVINGENKESLILYQNNKSLESFFNTLTKEDLYLPYI